MRGVDRLIAVDQIGVCKQMQQIVRARAANDAVGVEPEGAPDRLAQLARSAIRIILKVVGGGLIGRDRLRAWSKRRLVRRQFDHPGHARRAALTGHIGLDLEHAGPGLRTRCRHYFLTPGSTPLPFSGGRGLCRAPYSGSRDCRRGPTSGSWRRYRLAPRERRNAAALAPRPKRRAIEGVVGHCDNVGDCRDGVGRCGVQPDTRMLQTSSR